MVMIVFPVAVALACAVFRQTATAFPPLHSIIPPDEQEERKVYEDLYISPYDTQYIQYDDNPNVYVASDEAYELPPSDTDDLHIKETSLLKRWEEINNMNPDYELPDYNQLFLMRLLGIGERYRKSFAEDQNPLSPPSKSIYSANLLPEIDDKNPQTSNDKIAEKTDEIKNKIKTEIKSKEEIELESLQKNEWKNKVFALTPINSEFFDAAPGQTSSNMNSFQQPRKIRQNPNLSRAKALVTENLDTLRLGFTEKDTKSTAKPHHIHVLESTKPKINTTIFTNTMLASVVASVTLAIVGFIFGWYTIFHGPSISKKAKAAAEMDYPSYGVTGPAVDVSGDRKLAHLAHMYHYQHQKQQILAMESCLGRNGSVSDLDSEEENEEGDYTVYECPGFATTGNMEVKNPLFNEEPTPATPDNCEVVQPQPKE